MKVISSNKKKFYEVTSSSCTCPDYVYRQAKSGGKCKHMIKYFYPNQAKEELEMSTNAIEYFRGGAEPDEADNIYGDKIPYWISIGEICESSHEGKRKYYLLE